MASNPLATANTKAGRIWRRKNIPGYAERVRARAASRTGSLGAGTAAGGINPLVLLAVGGVALYMLL